MKRYLFQVLLFLLAFVGFNIASIFLFIEYDWDFKKRVESITFKDPQFNCLILGNSYALDGINAEMLTTETQKTYNLSIAGASVRTNYIQFREYLDMYQTKPEKVILALDSFRHDFKNEVIHPVVEYTMEDHHYGLKDIPVVKFKWFYRKLLKKVLSSEHREAEIVQGQLRFAKSQPDRSKVPSDPPAIGKEHYITSPWVQSIARLCSENNIELIIVEMPAKAALRNSSPVGPLDLVLGNGIPVKVYNFNSVDFNFGIDPEKDWVGNSHLNNTGAQKFTKTLRDHISF